MHYRKDGVRLHSLASYSPLERRHLHFIQSAASRRGGNVVIDAIEQHNRTGLKHAGKHYFRFKIETIINK